MEKKEEEDKKKGSKRFLWDFFGDVILAGAISPELRAALSRILGMFFRKKIEKVEEKIGGVNIDEKGQGAGDEILFEEVVNAMEETQQDKINAFREWLRPQDADKHPTGLQKDTALVLFVAKGSKAFEQEIKSTTYKPRPESEDGKGKNRGQQDKEETKTSKRDLAWAKGYLSRMLKQTDNPKMLKFIENSNVFSLIPPKEPHPFEQAKEAYKKHKPEIEEAAERLAEQIEKRLFELDDNKKPREKANGEYIRKKIQIHWKFKTLKVFQWASILGIVAFIAYLFI